MPTPKVVVIMTDTQRKDMLGCYGNPDMKTPNLDRLASGGMRFERAYTCQPVCGPARSAIFTGTFPHSNGSWTNSYAMGDNVKTIGQRLTDHGIHTAYIGKWHLDGSDYFGNGICPDGWDADYWYDMRRYLEEMDDDFRMKSRKTATMQQEHIREEDTYGHRVSDRAIHFLQYHGEESFFLAVSYDEPHGPYLCPEPYASLYQGYHFPKSRNVWDTLEDKPDYQRVWGAGQLQQDRDALQIEAPYYLGCNAYVDYEIGRVLDSIQAYAPDALVIYTSDHGDFLCSHALNNKGPAFYDEIANIPFIAACPGVIPAHSVSNAPTSHIDIVPTILDFMGLEIPKLLEGRSMLPALQDPKATVNDKVFCEFGRYEVDHDGFGGFQPMRSVFDGRYKLSIHLLSTDELYDIQEDPDEMVNLIHSEAHMEVRNRLHDAILTWQNETRDPFRGYYWERRPWRTDARPATWEYTRYTRQRENEEYEPRQLDYATGLPMEKATRIK